MCSDHDYLTKRSLEELERASSAKNVCAQSVHLELAWLYAERLQTILPGAVSRRWPLSGSHLPRKASSSEMHPAMTRLK